MFFDCQKTDNSLAEPSLIFLKIAYINSGLQKSQNNGAPPETKQINFSIKIADTDNTMIASLIFSVTDRFLPILFEIVVNPINNAAIISIG